MLTTGDVYLCQEGFVLIGVCLFVCLLAGFYTKYLTDFRNIWWHVGRWHVGHRMNQYILWVMRSDVR